VAPQLQLARGGKPGHSSSDHEDVHWIRLSGYRFARRDPDLRLGAARRRAGLLAAFRAAAFCTVRVPFSGRRAGSCFLPQEVSGAMGAGVFCFPPFAK